MNTDSVGPGLGNDNGNDNNNGFDGGLDNDVGINDVSFDEDEPDAIESGIEQAVDQVADTIENVTGLSISDKQRQQIAEAVAQKVADKGTATAQEVTAAVIEKALSTVGIAGGRQIANAVLSVLNNPGQSPIEAAKTFAGELAKQGLSVASMNPLAKAVAGPILEQVTNPDYGFADLMGDIASVAVNFVGHAVLGSLSLGSANIAAAVGINKLGDMAGDAVEGHIEQAIANGDVINPGEEGFDVAKGPGSDKSEPILLRGNDSQTA